jgi:hypothetical protein
VRQGGAAVGIKFLSGGKLHLENSTVFGFSGDPLLFQPSGASGLFVNNTGFRSNYGSVYIFPTSTGTANAVFNGVKLEYGFRGVRADDGSTVLIRNSIATGNEPGNGFAATTAAQPPRPAIITIENSSASLNAAAGVVANGSMAVVRISNVTATDNGSYGAWILNGGVIYSFGTNRFAGNALGDMVAGTALTPSTEK